MKIIRVYKPFKWSKPLRIVSHIIRKVTGDRWHHVALLDEQYISESDFKGVIQTYYKEWINDYQLQIIEVPSDEYEKNEYYKIIHYFVDAKPRYAFEDLLWMLIWYFTKFLFGRGYFLGSKSKCKNYPTCYEYVARVLNMENWYRMTPTEFKNECDKRGYKVIAECSDKDLYLYI